LLQTNTSTDVAQVAIDFDEARLSYLLRALGAVEVSAAHVILVQGPDDTSSSSGVSVQLVFQTGSTIDDGAKVAVAEDWAGGEVQVIGPANYPVDGTGPRPSFGAGHVLTVKLGGTLSGLTDAAHFLVPAKLADLIVLLDLDFPTS